MKNESAPHSKHHKSGSDSERSKKLRNALRKKINDNKTEPDQVLRLKNK